MMAPICKIFQHRHAREDAPPFRRLRNAEPRDCVGGQLGDVLAVEQNAAL